MILRKNVLTYIFAFSTFFVCELTVAGNFIIERIKTPEADFAEITNDNNLSEANVSTLNSDSITNKDKLPLIINDHNLTQLTNVEKLSLITNDEELVLIANPDASKISSITDEQKSSTIKQEKKIVGSKPLVELKEIKTLKPLERVNEHLRSVDVGSDKNQVIKQTRNLEALKVTKKLTKKNSNATDKMITIGDVNDIFMDFEEIKIEPKVKIKTKDISKFINNPVKIKRFSPGKAVPSQKNYNKLLLKHAANVKRENVNNTSEIITKTKTKTKIELEAKAKTMSQIHAKAKPDVQIETKVDVKPQIQVKVKPASKFDNKFETLPVTNVKTKVKTTLKPLVAAQAKEDKLEIKAKNKTEKIQNQAKNLDIAQAGIVVKNDSVGTKGNKLTNLSNNINVMIENARNSKLVKSTTESFKKSSIWQVILGLSLLFGIILFVKNKVKGKAKSLELILSEDAIKKHKENKDNRDQKETYTNKQGNISIKMIKTSIAKPKPLAKINKSESNREETKNTSKLKDVAKLKEHSTPVLQAKVAKTKKKPIAKIKSVVKTKAKTTTKKPMATAKSTTNPNIAVKTKVKPLTPKPEVVTAKRKSVAKTKKESLKATELRLKVELAENYLNLGEKKSAYKLLSEVVIVATGDVKEKASYLLKKAN